MRSLFINSAIALIALSALIYLIWALRPLILPVILGILLAYLFRPLKTTFKYPWLPNGIRVAVLFGLLTGGLLFGIRFVKNNIPNDQQKLEILVRTKYKFNEKFNKVMAIDPVTGRGNAIYNLIAPDINPLRISLNSYLDLSPEQTESFLNFYKGEDGVEPVPEKYYKYFLANVTKSNLAATLKADIAKTAKANNQLVAGQNQSFLKNLIEILSIWFLLPIVFVFFLLDDGAIAQYFISLFPNRYFELALTIREEVDDAIGKYLRGISLQSGLVGISMASGLFVVGVPLKMSLLIGLLCGLGTAIPFLGPIIGLGFGLTYTLIAEDIQPLLWFITIDNIPIAVVVVNVSVMFLDSMVFQPIVLGSAVDLHPLVIVLGIMGGSMMFGMSGVLLAIPAIVVLNVIIQQTFRGLKEYRII